mmetsp:Transcript_63248/g.105253  ORF Transcript_63248/g.105253 Transcript_63248/m.105253 type:complete len:105 (-) Transcript_63248:121-435(-)
MPPAAAAQNETAPIEVTQSEKRHVPVAVAATATNGQHACAKAVESSFPQQTSPQPPLEAKQLLSNVPSNADKQLDLAAQLDPATLQWANKVDSTPPFAQNPANN